MRPLRIVVIGASLVVAGLGTFLFVPAFERTGGGGALALSPTPAVFDIAWTVETSEQPVAGRAIQLKAVAVPADGGRSYGGVVKDPSYSLSIEGDRPPLELSGEANVSPDDVLDGATWQLQALGEGEATLVVRLDYTLSYWITGTPPGSYPVSDVTSATLIVEALLGDVSCDGAADARDAALVLQLAAELIDALSCTGGDVDGDGATGSLDAALILQYVAGLLTGLGPPAG